MVASIGISDIKELDTLENLLLNMFDYVLNKALSVPGGFNYNALIQADRRMYFDAAVECVRLCA